MDRADQEQLTDTLVAMARYLDDDHLQTAVLAMCRDAEAIPMVFWRRDVEADAAGCEEHWDPHEMFVLLHGQPYESAHQKMVERLIEKRQDEVVRRGIAKAFAEGQDVTIEVPKLVVEELDGGGVAETKDD